MACEASDISDIYPSERRARRFEAKKRKHKIDLDKLARELQEIEAWVNRELRRICAEKLS